jgi:hypothetical protein
LPRRTGRQTSSTALCPGSGNEPDGGVGAPAVAIQGVLSSHDHVALSSESRSLMLIVMKKDGLD